MTPAPSRPTPHGRWVVADDRATGVLVLTAPVALDTAAGVELRHLTRVGADRRRVVVLVLDEVRGATPGGLRALADTVDGTSRAGVDLRVVCPVDGTRTLDVVLARDGVERHDTLASALDDAPGRGPTAAVAGDGRDAARGTISPTFFSFREHDLDGARAAVGQDFFSLSIDLVDPDAPYEFRFDGVVFGALAVATSYVSAGMELSMGDLEDCYYVNYARAGSMRTRHRHGEVDVVPGTGALYHPVGPVRMTSSDRYGSYAVRVDRLALVAALEERLGHAVRPDPVLGMRLDVAGAARWDRLVRLVCAEATAAPSVLSHPIVAAPLHDAVVDGLLRAADHPWRAELERPSRAWSRIATDRAVAAMRADPGHPFTPTVLAGIAGTSMRTLHDGFRRHLGVSPMAYLRAVRLQRAHVDLRAADPATTTVSDVALRWGFTHLGRFAAEYGRVHGRPPSATLASAR